MVRFADKKVLVTGSGGFIGSHLVERLLKLGVSVRAFLHYNSRSDEGSLKFVVGRYQKLEITYGDLKELETVREAVKGCGVVFNLAALVGVPYSFKHPQEVVETNTIGTLNILLATRDVGITRLIQTSTSEVYGSAIYVPIDEKHPVQPQSPYSASKIAADALTMSFYYSFNLPITIIRPFNCYGPRQSLRAVIPTIISQALVSNEVLLGRTSTTRDITYISDTIDAFIKVSESEKAIGQVINIGSGEEISVAEIVNQVGNILGKKISIKIDENRFRPEKSEVTRLCADNSKAQELLGWQRRVDLEKGLRLTIDYIRKHYSEYSYGKYYI